MTLTFNNLEQDAKWVAIYTYCKHMNCFGLEGIVDEFLKTSKNIFFDENGRLLLNPVK